MGSLGAGQVIGMSSYVAGSQHIPLLCVICFYCHDA